MLSYSANEHKVYLISETKVQLNLRAASPVTDDSRYISDRLESKHNTFTLGE